MPTRASSASKGSDCCQALRLVLGRGGRCGGVLVRLGEPASRLERLSKHARQLRRRLADHGLRLAKALGVLERGDRRVELCLRVLRRGHRLRAIVIPSAIATIEMSIRSSFGELLVERDDRVGGLVVGVGIEHAAVLEHVVEQDQAARARPLERLLEVVGVAGLVGVDEDEVEVLALGQLAKRLGGGAGDDLDTVGDAGRLEVARRRLGVLLGELEAEQAAGRRQPAGDRDRRVAGEGPDLERLLRADRAREELHERALVGRDLHRRDRAHRRRFLLDAREDLVLARPVLDHVGVEVVVELRCTCSSRASPPCVAERPQRPPTSPPAIPAHTLASGKTIGVASRTAAATATAIGS